MDIEYTEHLDTEVLDLLDNEFKIYAREKEINGRIYKCFNFIAKEQNEIAGILKGHSLYDEVIVDELIVIKKYRGKGIGTELLKKAIDHHQNKGFNCLSLWTRRFLAPKFYEKLGFELEFVRENKKNPQLSKYFFVKYF